MSSCGTSRTTCSTGTGGRSRLELFCEMVGARRTGCGSAAGSAVLGGPCPFDRNWLDLMGERGVLGAVSAIGLPRLPRHLGQRGEQLGRLGGLHLGEMRAILDRYNPDCEIWITEAGYSTWRNDEWSRRAASSTRCAPADRLYWYGWRDLPRHAGAGGAVVRPAPLPHGRASTCAGQRSCWHGCCARAAAVAAQGEADARARAARPRIPSDHRRRGLHRLEPRRRAAEDGREVIVFDNLSRAGRRPTSTG
jgi:CDP-paratose 2-epimerase